MPEGFIDLLRHGEVVGDACFRGSRDDPLSPRGWEQMQAACAGARPWTRILSSPLQRCAAFARHLAAELQRPCTLDAALQERDFGDWEGVPAARLPAAELARFWRDPASVTPPGAEPLAAFRARLQTPWQALLADANRGAHTLVVTHGGVIRILIAEVLGMPDGALLRLEVPHACLTRLRLPEAPGYPSLLFHRAP